MTDIQALQADKLEAQKFIEKSAKLKKLQSNAVFKELFLKEYCEEDVTRLVGALANADEAMKKTIVAELEGISRFKMHMRFIEQMGEAAESKIAEIDEAIEELNQEA